MASLIAIAAIHGAPALAAQTRGLTEGGLDSIARRVEFIDPHSGPPGTLVTIRSGGMPAVTPLRIGIGAVHFGFEEIGQVLTNEKGEFTLTVTVPNWARRDLVHRFIVFDFYFAPIALSDIFHVTDATGTIERVGELLNVGDRCPALRSDDGLSYSLAGDISGFAEHARVVVEGRITPSGECGRDTTVRITRIAPGNS